MQKPEFFNVLAEFAVWPKTDDITLDFFDFLSAKYPDIWPRLNMFYADAEEYEDINPRMARYGWDELLEPKYFGDFLRAIKSIWPFLVDNEYGVCEYCKKEGDLDLEHSVFVSYDFGPMVKFYDHQEMDGSCFHEVWTCRNCATRIMTKIMDKMDPDKVTCCV